MNLISRQRKIGVFAAGSVLLLFIGLFGLLATVPAVSPSTGAQVADLLRSALGPSPVAWLEGRSLAIQDAVNRFMSTYDGGRKGISLAQTGAGRPLPNQQSKALATGGSAASSLGSGRLAPLPATTGNAVTAAPQIGWQPFGPLINGSPVMAQTLVSLDPQRPYAGIALVRMDLSMLRLHMMPGYQEPSHAQDVVSSFPHLGLTPPADQLHLVAGFNGGFKAINGHYGMLTNGVTLLPPVPGLATLAIYKDGHIAIGAWGQDLLPSADIVAFRQNCPPLLQNGQIGPLVSVDNRSIWGNTVGNTEITWRTGLGLTQDGRYLIYAVGNGTTVETLAQALQQAGAYTAMQLDINRPFAHFVTYQPTGSPAAPRRAVPLLDQMEKDPYLYLVPHPRLFLSNHPIRSSNALLIRRPAGWSLTGLRDVCIKL